MDERSVQLRDHYRALSTDELLAIRVGAIELTEMANELLNAELKTRGVALEDFLAAQNTQRVVDAERRTGKMLMRLWMWSILVLIALVGIVGVYAEFVARPSAGPSIRVESGAPQPPFG